MSLKQTPLSRPRRTLDCSARLDFRRTPAKFAKRFFVGLISIVALMLALQTITPQIPR